MKYAIISAASTEELEKKIATELAAGWEPLGGVAAISATPKIPVFIQAVVKR